MLVLIHRGMKCTVTTKGKNRIVSCIYKDRYGNLQIIYGENVHKLVKFLHLMSDIFICGDNIDLMKFKQHKPTEVIFICLFFKQAV